MQTHRQARLLPVALSLLCTAHAAHAQPHTVHPTIPKDQIAPELPADVKQHIEQLYVRPGKEIGALLAMDRRALPALPFLRSMLHDTRALPMAVCIASSYASRVRPAGNDTYGGWAAEMIGCAARAYRATPLTVALRDALVQSLHDKDARRRLNAVRALCEMSDPRALEPLLAMLKDPDPRVRNCTARGLGMQGLRHPRAVEPLITVLTDPKEQLDVRSGAAGTLGDLEDPRAVDPLVAVLRSAPPQQDTEPAHSKTIYTHAWLRARAANALGEIADPRALGPLLVALKDPDPDMRAAATSMGNIPHPRALAALANDALHDESGQVRRMAAYWLGRAKNPQAVEPLIAALHDPADPVRTAAATALGAINDQRARRPLVKLALREKRLSQARTTLRALEQLGHHGAKHALSRFRKMGGRKWRDWWQAYKQDILGESAM